MLAALRSLAIQQFGCAAPETGDRSQVASGISSAHPAADNAGSKGRKCREKYPNREGASRRLPRRR